MVIHETTIEDEILTDRESWFAHLGYLPVEQDIFWAKKTEPNSRWILYKLFDKKVFSGFALVKVKKRILADIYFGPVVFDEVHYLPFLGLIVKQLRKKLIFALRLIPPTSAPEVEGENTNFNWATIVINLIPDEDVLFQSFNKNHRYSIRKTIEKNVTVSALKRDELPEFVDGYIEMYRRRKIYQDKVAITQIFNNIYDAATESPDKGMVLAIHHPEDKHIVAGGIFLRSGNTMYYRHGFSLRCKGLSLMHVLIWKAICYAKKQGCTRFDMGGYSLDPDPQLSGINDFKKWFSGDLIINPRSKVIGLYPFGKTLLKIAGANI